MYLQNNSAKYTTHWESYGEYDIKNKTFYIIPLDSNISENNLEFKEFANEFEKSLILFCRNYKFQYICSWKMVRSAYNPSGFQDLGIY